jgi:hypothetical protein
MAQRYHQRPSEWIFDRRPDAYARYCFDQAIYIRAVIEENESYRRARGKAHGDVDDGPDEHAPQRDTLKLGAVTLEGAFSGEVGAFGPGVLEKWLQAGGKLPPDLQERYRDKIEASGVSLER